MRASKRLAVFCFDLLFFAFGTGLLFASFATPAFAYVDPSVMTYTIQALAGVVVALSAVILLRLRSRPAVPIRGHPSHGPSGLVSLCWRWPSSCSRFFVAAPFDLVDGNKESLFFSIHDVWLILVVFAFVTGSIVALLISCLRGKAFDVLVAVIFALGVAGFVQALLLNVGLPTADGHEVVWSNYSANMVVGVVVWLAIVSAAVFFVVKAPSLGRFSFMALAVFLILVQGIAIARLIKHAIFGTSDYVVTKEGLFEVSGKSNVIVFVIDTVDTQEFDCVLQQYPDVLDGYDGFTYFRNSVGSMIPTAYGVPFLVTGQMLQDDEDYHTYLDARFTNSTFVPDMRERRERLDRAVRP